jgi:hypothetical protein
MLLSRRPSARPVGPVAHAAARRPRPSLSALPALPALPEHADTPLDTTLALLRSRDALVHTRGLTGAQASTLVAVVHDNGVAVAGGAPLCASRLLRYARTFETQGGYTRPQVHTLLRGLWTLHIRRR